MSKLDTLDTAEHKLIDDGNEEAALALETFESRWRYAVFPAMVAFIILAAFGFYLIYGILQRMESMSVDINRMTNLMEKTIPAISKDVHDLNESIATNMPELENHVKDMSQNVSAMAVSANSMSISTRNMGQSTWELNRSISKPMKMMNKVIPWKSDAPPPLPPVYRHPYSY